MRWMGFHALAFAAAFACGELSAQTGPSACATALTTLQSEVSPFFGEYALIDGTLGSPPTIRIRAVDGTGGARIELVTSQGVRSIMFPLMRSVEWRQGLGFWDWRRIVETYRQTQYRAGNQLVGTLFRRAYWLGIVPFRPDTLTHSLIIDGDRLVATVDRLAPRVSDDFSFSGVYRRINE